MFPGDAYNQFISIVKEDVSNSYSNPNQIEINRFGLSLSISFKDQAGTGYVKSYGLD